MNKEIWRPLPFAHQYEVSNYGRVKSHIKKRILSPTLNQWGYAQLTLRVDGHKKYFKVHHLVLMAFAGDRPDGCECNHIDGNHANNHLENLEWVTHRENMAHSIKTGLQARGERCHTAKLKENEVLEIKKMLLAGNMTRVEIAKRFDVSRKLIYMIRVGRSWSHVVLPVKEAVEVRWLMHPVQPPTRQE